MEINALEIFNKVYPVGSIYLSVNNSNPSNYFGGTWVAWGSGRVPVGVNTSDSNFNTVEKTGGESEHALTTNEIPSHNHRLRDAGGNEIESFAAMTPDGTGYDVMQQSGYRTYKVISRITTDVGGSQPHNNLQPYITCYMWKRTA